MNPSLDIMLENRYEDEDFEGDSDVGDNVILLIL